MQTTERKRKKARKKRTVCGRKIFRTLCILQRAHCLTSMCVRARFCWSCTKEHERYRNLRQVRATHTHTERERSKKTRNR